MWRYPGQLDTAHGHHGSQPAHGGAQADTGAPQVRREQLARVEVDRVEVGGRGELADDGEDDPDDGLRAGDQGVHHEDHGAENQTNYQSPSSAEIWQCNQVGK